MRLNIEDLTNIRFTELIIALAEADFLGSRCKEAILDIDRQELIRKSDYLYQFIDDSYPEGVSLGYLRELITYCNWGAPHEIDWD